MLMGGDKSEFVDEGGEMEIAEGNNSETGVLSEEDVEWVGIINVVGFHYKR